MITREQVADIITTALATAHQPEDAQAFAARLATALDALGLLQFCDINEPEQLNQPEDANTPNPNQQPPDSWASMRSRT